MHRQALSRVARTKRPSTLKPEGSGWERALWLSGPLIPPWTQAETHALPLLTQPARLLAGSSCPWHSQGSCKGQAPRCWHSPTQAQCFCGLSQLPGQRPAPNQPPTPQSLPYWPVSHRGPSIRSSSPAWPRALPQYALQGYLEKLEIKSSLQVKGTDKAFRRKQD